MKQLGEALFLVVYLGLVVNGLWGEIVRISERGGHDRDCAAGRALNCPKKISAQ